MKAGDGNTAVSMGGIKIPQSEAVAFEYLMSTFRFGVNEVDETLVRTFCREIMSAKDFLTGLLEGAKLMVYGHAGYPQLPHADVIYKYCVRGKQRGGDALFDLYHNGVEEKRGIEIRYASVTLRYPRIPSWAVLDTKSLMSGPIIGQASGYGINREGVKWSNDNTEEVKKGWIIEAATLSGPAQKIGVPAENLEASVSRWNADLKAGGDTVFGRPVRRNPKHKATYLDRAAPVISKPL